MPPSGRFCQKTTLFLSVALRFRELTVCLFNSETAGNRRFSFSEDFMKRIASVSIIVEKAEATEQINNILHEYADLIIGRMGLPLREYGVSVITLVIIGEDGEISALSGAVGRISGVSVKASFSKKEIE